MARNTTITQPADDTKDPAVDEREPIRTEGADENADDETEGDVADADASTRTEDGPGVRKATRGGTDNTAKPKTGKEAAKLASGEPNVSGPGGDGATMSPAVGTSREMADRLSTKEGGAPIGVERDQGTGGDPHLDALAGVSSFHPAGTLGAKQSIDKVHAAVTEVINDFSTGQDRETMVGSLNLFDDCGVQRAHIVHLAAKIEEKFGIDITPSEAQNFLLVRDVTNQVLRKLAAQG